jgi:hypothetical protein
MLKRFEGGTIIVDHSASPGLPEDIARAAGYDPKLTGEGKVFEAATLTCAHCKSSVVKNHFRIRERAFCPKCVHYICDFCHAASKDALYTHLPFEKLAETTIREAEKQISYGSPPGLFK